MTVLQEILSWPIHSVISLDTASRCDHCFHVAHAEDLTFLVCCLCVNIPGHKILHVN